LAGEPGAGGEGGGWVAGKEGGGLLRRETSRRPPFLALERRGSGGGRGTKDACGKSEREKETTFFLSGGKMAKREKRGGDLLLIQFAEAERRVMVGVCVRGTSSGKGRVGALDRGKRERKPAGQVRVRFSSGEGANKSEKGGGASQISKAKGRKGSQILGRENFQSE